MQCNTYLPDGGGGLLFLSQVASVTPLRAVHPSTGGKQKLFVIRPFVKGDSEESNEALISFLHNAPAWLRKLVRLKHIFVVGQKRTLEGVNQQDSRRLGMRDVDKCFGRPSS